MTATIDKSKNMLNLSIPLSQPRRSATGKTMLVATHSGPVNVEVDGKPVRVTLSAYIKP